MLDDADKRINDVKNYILNTLAKDDICGDIRGSDILLSFSYHGLDGVEKSLYYRIGRWLPYETISSDEWESYFMDTDYKDSLNLDDFLTPNVIKVILNKKSLYKHAKKDY